MDRGERWCFGCLQRRIAADFSDKLVFSYGITDSAFPFGTSAVVQLPSASGENSTEFTLAYLPTHENDCLTKYVYSNEYLVEKPNGSDTKPGNKVNSFAAIQDQGAGGSKIFTNQAQSGHTSEECQCFLHGNQKMSPPGSGYEAFMHACDYCSHFSCSRTITALTSIAHIGSCACFTFEEVASGFLSGSIEDHILSSLSLLIEGKATGRDAVNFLSLIGVPSFNEDKLPGCLRHPNIVPILGMLKSSDNHVLILPKTPNTLENALTFSPDVLKSDWHRRFLIYQLLSALSFIHGLGISHGNVCPSNVVLSDSCWLWLCISDEHLLGESDIVDTPSRIGCCTEGCLSQGLYNDLKLAPSIDWHPAFNQWRRGDLSNFEYLLILNKLARRKWGDHTFYTVMPWVIDFSIKPDESSEAGWRDLCKSKWRLAKGDEQLNFTYSTSEVPHHVPDECLSELAVCSYKARRLPLSVLRTAVRSVYEPNEYPLTLQRLYQWTPDECIPEFYCDPQIFYSLHPGMTDLAIPGWVGTPEEFIKFHRDALESNHVSLQIHHWIDIIFGYKMSGEAAIAAKNVMLSSTESTMPKSVGRRQLFTQPHPSRYSSTRKLHDSPNDLFTHRCLASGPEYETHMLDETAYLHDLENASMFGEHASHLNPVYSGIFENIGKNTSSFGKPNRNRFKKSLLRNPNSMMPAGSGLDNFLQYIELDDEASWDYQDLFLWSQKLSYSSPSENLARDIFSVGCILAELHLKKPLFDSTSLAVYLENDTLPGLMEELPTQTKILVETCIRRDWRRRPSAYSLLGSPYFLATIKSAYLFIAPLQLMAKQGSRLHYAATFANQGGLKAMGPFAAEVCVSYCLPLLVAHSTDSDAELAFVLLKEFLKFLQPKAIKTFMVPAIQKILQASGCSHLKVCLLQDSFVQELWNCVGKLVYMEAIHPFILLNLYDAPLKSSAVAASVLLIGSCEELGVPVTIHQTILPLIQHFGKGLCTDGLDVLVRIGGLFGEEFIVKQILPLLKKVLHSCVNVSCTNKSEPMQNWCALACIDCLMVLDGLVAVLPREVVVQELIQGQNCLHVTVLMQANLDLSVLQVAAATLIVLCQRIGPELTASQVLPQLKELFEELAFSQQIASESNSPGRVSKVCKAKANEEYPMESRMDLVFHLYPSFASILGIENLRQCCATWLLLEQFLLRCHNWKWENTMESSKNLGKSRAAERPILTKDSPSYHSPAKMLFNGIGWSVPQSQGNRNARNLMPQKQFYEHRSPVETHVTTSNPGKHGPWFWFPSSDSIWDGLDFLGRSGGLKDVSSWKIRASVIYSVRAHHGALRSLAVFPDECTAFTGGVGPGFKGTVQKWDFSRINHVSGYHGHEEVVNDMCILTPSRVASSDGTVHVWNSQTGKLISKFSESSSESSYLSSSHFPASKTHVDQGNMLYSNSISTGILTSTFDGTLYTCMHLLEFVEKLVIGTGNGSLRFIDIAQGQKLHLWHSDSSWTSYPSLISSLCSCGSDKTHRDGTTAYPSWIAAGLSSGHCRLLDARSGNVFASWHAHDGYLTKLAAPEDHLLISSSLDKTLRIWDLRRGWPSQPIAVRGHKDGVSSFSVWGQDIISISGNKIGLSSLTRNANEDGYCYVAPQKLYLEDRGMRNLSALSCISIMPFSRLFLVGTEDGHMRICC